MSDLREMARREWTSRSFDRRTVSAGLAALLTSGWSRQARAAPSGPLRVGSATIETASDGTLASSLSFMLPDTPRPDVDAAFRAEGLQTEASPIPTNATLVRIGADVTLIDAGSGNSFQPTAGKLGDNLEAMNVSREAVTKVVFTHAHPDHLWGAIDDFDDSERFPNASYVVPAAEWDFWTRDDVETLVPDWLKGLSAGSRRTLKRLADKMERRKPGDTIMPGLTYVATPGHTPGHASVLVEVDGEQVLIGGDALSHAVISFRRPAWAFGSDLDRDLAARTRIALLDRLANERITLVGFHLPDSGIGRVERTGDAYRFIPA